MGTRYLISEKIKAPTTKPMAPFCNNASILIALFEGISLINNCVIIKDDKKTITRIKLIITPTSLK